MLISQAFAADAPATETTAETAVPGADPTMAPSSTQSIVIQNVGMIVLLIVMFYFLLIRPQQKRFKEHKEMIDALKVGDKIVTSGGLIGKISELSNDNEVIVDLGNSIKVTALRNTIQVRPDKTADTEKKK